MRFVSGSQFPLRFLGLLRFPRFYYSFKSVLNYLGLVGLVWWVTASVAYAQSEFFDYLDAVHDQATAMQLHQNPHWLRLLHINPLSVDGESDIEDPGFFFSQGAQRGDPEAELHETIEAFLDPVFEKGDSHGICLYPARFHWLNQQLKFDPQYLPPVECERYEAWRKLINAQSVSLVFASSFMGNPGSVFGHTFLKINQKKGNTALNLLAFVVQYQAGVSDEEIGFEYAVRGVFGGYEGYYMLQPYYVPVRSNIEFEDRSLWEYELNLTEQETEVLVMHSWELSHTNIPYYFFLENCAYRILELIQIAAPQYELKEPFYLWAIPSTAVREVVDQDNLVAQVNYFPARTRQLLQKFEALNASEQALVVDIAHNPDSLNNSPFQNLSLLRQGLVLDTAVDFITSRLNENHDDASAKQIRRQLLRARSRLGSLEEVSLPPAHEIPIELGHRPNKIRLGLGVDDFRPFQEITTWPAYHDLLADEQGHLENSQLIAGQFQFRHYEATEDDNEQWTLHRFEVVNVMNLSPHNRIKRDSSWALLVAAQPSTKKRCPVCRKFRGAISYGWSTAFSQQSGLFYALGHTTVEVDDAYDYDYLVGAGVLTGLTWEWSTRWKALVSLEVVKGVLGDPHDYVEAQIHQRWTLAQNWDARLEVNYRNPWEGLAAVNYYF